MKMRENLLLRKYARIHTLDIGEKDKENIFQGNRLISGFSVSL